MKHCVACVGVALCLSVEKAGFGVFFNVPYCEGVDMTAEGL